MLLLYRNRQCDQYTAHLGHRIPLYEGIHKLLMPQCDVEVTHLLQFPAISTFEDVVEVP